MDWQENVSHTSNTNATTSTEMKSTAVSNNSKLRSMDTPIGHPIITQTGICRVSNMFQIKLGQELDESSWKEILVSTKLEFGYCAFAFWRRKDVLTTSIAIWVEEPIATAKERSWHSTGTETNHQFSFPQEQKNTQIGSIWQTQMDRKPKP